MHLRDIAVVRRLILVLLVAVAVSACAPSKFTTPHASEIELEDDFEILSSKQFGGSGGHIDRWVLVVAPSNDLDRELERAIAMMIDAGWERTDIDCGGDTPPCRPADGIVLTDGDGRYAYPDTEPPSVADRFDTQGLDTLLLWWRLTYEGWGVGR